MKKQFIPSLALILFVSLNGSAAEIFVEPARGSGVPQSDLDSATALVQSAVPQVNGNQVTSDQSKADFSLRPDLVKLGKSYVLTLSKVRGGEVQNTTQLKAQSIEELDKVALRVTQAVIANKKASDDAQVGEITNHEAREGTQRKPVRSLHYLALGGSLFGNLNSSKLGYSLGVGHGWDSNQMIIKVNGDLSIAGDAALIAATLGLDYFLTAQDFAPYIGGNFGVGAAKSEGGFFSSSMIGGFVLAPEAGFQILRTSTVSMDICFRAEFLMNSNEYGHPAAYSLKVGLYF